MHGHLNVAMSRIRDANNIAVHIVENDYDNENQMVVTTNVVYPEIINALKINM
jgi:predicted nucleic acid-binding protein